MKYIVLFLVRIIFLPLRLVLSLFRTLFRSRKPPYPEKKDLIKMSREGDVVNVNYDALNEKDQEDFRKAVTEELDLPRYDGEVTHAYELKYIKDPKTCPRCQSETRQSYANFIYATQVAPRVMFTPAGFFCIKCPTVIIDHEMIKIGVAKKFQFQGVVGIDYDTKKETDLFQTWNSKQVTYIFDENQNILGLSTSPIKSHSHSSKKRKNQKRKQIAKQSRRKNRRRA